LIRRTLAIGYDYEDDTPYWRNIRELRRRGTAEVFEAMAALCRSACPRKQILGIEVLGQLGVEEKPFREVSLPILFGFLRSRAHPELLETVLYALGHLRAYDDPRGSDVIASFAGHLSPLVRRAVPHALYGHEDTVAVETLIRLSLDVDDKTRDWATFALGTIEEGDTPAIREALLARLDDLHGDTRCEAVRGLAERRDPRVRKALIRELERPDAGNLVFEAARAFGDPALLPLVERHLCKAGDHVGRHCLNIARDARQALLDVEKRGSVRRHK
jgi:HEAT repeat protein